MNKNSSINVKVSILDLVNTEVISIIDISDWGLALDKPAIIEVTSPGSNKVHTHYFQQNKINNLFAYHVGQKCESCDLDREPLEDGIYNIKVIASPDTFYHEFKYLRTTAFEQELREAAVKLIQAGVSNSKVIAKLNKALGLLRIAKSFINSDDLCSAQEFIRQAHEALDKFNCKVCDNE